ncbi:acetylxylan esterase [Streptomyces sp. NBC_00873]|uniref:acetylxylan esterase n=1 Tax=unclassified Streptomyces TaxID=2593676 RepID=UPI0038688D1C|nr:acetylxylan esterase [Streptomyces sp. NBC_00873]WTA48701.1 acetylxylan esterase [Streptomyces sp. NBC_00842]
MYPLDPEFQSYDVALSAAEIHDVTFSGWGGGRIRARLNVPSGAEGPLPCVVHYLGSAAAEGCLHDHLVRPRR